MSGDYSRIAFDPARNYSGVLLQQGRPLTDSDWNEEVAAVNRRAQAGTLDTAGPVAVSVVTPDAFKILPGLAISPGRMYVDGLLADNRGGGPVAWNTALAELYGTTALPFVKQPYGRGLADPPGTGGPYLVYLDVWQREVTQFEDPDIVEKALGVDTTTRLQTVWQVKLSDPLASGTTCATATGLPGPSAGRLTTFTGPVSNPDPCLIPPMGGYKGLENQLYRIEVHKEGPLGTATFKWSRDNASVVARVTRIVDSSNFIVDSVGRDSVLRFSDGDWIEITDDWRELNGKAGDLHRIKIGGGVDDATRTISVEPALTIDLGPADALGNLDPTRHARIRRWDQKGKILDQAGTQYVDLDAGTIGDIVIPAGGTSLQIEDGLLVTFSVDPAGGGFRVGDYWVCAARASDATIDILTKAPPRGIHHHYAKLAVFTPPSGLQDCRPKPEECCCSITVAPGGDIQGAIDALPEEGGCVCLKAGLHVVPKTVLIGRSNVKLVGESRGTIVRSASPGAVLMIGGATPVQGVDIATIDFERIATRVIGGVIGQEEPTGVAAVAREGAAGPILAAPTNGDPAAPTNGNSGSTAPALSAVIAASNVRRGTIRDCGARALPAQQSIGIQLANVQEFHVENCRMQSVAMGIVAAGAQCKALFIDDNVINLGDDSTISTFFGIVIQEISGPCRIGGNVVGGVASGIVVNGTLHDSPQPTATDVFVVKNVVRCSPVSGGNTDNPVHVFGIDLAAHSGIVAQNMVILPGTSWAHAGIRATGDDLDVIDNQVTPGAAIPATAGAFIGIQVGETGALANDARVAGNIVMGCRIGIAAKSASTVIIESNIVETASSAGNAGVLLTTVKGGQVQDNRVTGSGLGISALNGTANSVTGNTLANGRIGVAMSNEVAPVIARNRIDAMDTCGISCGPVTGNCEIAENRIASCGFTANPGVGILVFQIGGELRIVSNQVMDTGLSPDRKTVAAQARGIAGTFVLEASIEDNYVGYTDPTLRPATNEDRALTMSCLLEIQSPFAANIRDGYPIQILGNKFTGAGKSALIEILEQVSGQQHMRFERISFSNNWCMHYPPYAAGTPASKTAATVVLFGRIATVMGNHIKALRPPANVAPFASVNFNGMPGPFVGNVTSGAVLQHTQFPAPETNFNMTF
jgi:hypothetical protein